MIRIRKVLPVLGLVSALSLSLSGCSDDRSVNPTEDVAPVLPAPERLTFDFDYFQEPSQLERASKNNFFNAYIRAVVASAITHYLLAPPVAAFALAFDTVPSPQPDGSWLWVYTWVDGSEEVQVRLRGKEIADEHVLWEMRASNTAEGFEQELWFEGETWDDAVTGVFRFHDFQREGKPVVASVEWGEDENGKFLSLTDEYDHAGDSLEYREDGTLNSFTFRDASDPDLSWFVKWNEADGTGSLRAPDYNGGQEACWDEHQNDAVCPVL